VATSTYVWGVFVVVTPHTAFPRRRDYVPGRVQAQPGRGGLTGVDGLYCSGSFPPSLFLSALAA
jgi:hypothetical protein